MREKLAKDVFLRQMQEKQDEIEMLLIQNLPREKSFQKTIFSAMEYSLLAGGKRLRPMMMKEAFLLFRGRDEETLSLFMAAIEMIHTYSLVHDDLPAMDNDEYRRGKWTTHKKYGEDMGILAGDALLNYAYELAAKAVKESAEIENAAKALCILTTKAGVYGMVGGQVVDVEMTGKSLTKEQIDFIYRLKTSALLEASLMIGATLAGAEAEDVAKMEQVGRNVGLAFQIQDDILDLVSTTEELGKPVGSDAKNEKVTFVSLHGMEAAKQAVSSYSKEALSLMEGLSVQNPYLNTLIEMLISRKK